MKTKTKQSLIALITASAMALPMAFAAGEPDNVNNVNADPSSDTSIQITWDDAKDEQGNNVDHYRVYYGTESVQGGQAADYQSVIDTPNSLTEYEVTDLVTGTPYYVSVTAISTEGIESLEWSIESSATPGGDSNTETTSSEPSVDTLSPTVVNVVAADKNHVLVGFSEEITLPNLLPEAAFSISEQINASNLLEVLAAEMYADDPENRTVLLETTDQIKNVNYIVTVSVAVVDQTGNPISSGNADSGIFLGSDQAVSIVNEEPVVEEVETSETETTETIDEAAEALLEETPGEIEDTTPPEDIRNLVLDFREDLTNFVVTMNWLGSINSAQDLVDQILYQSLDLGLTYDDGTSLGPISTNHEVGNLEGGKEYTFKIATVDDDGNESVGVVKSIRLPQTGLGTGFLVLSSAGLTQMMLKRRRRKKEQDVF